MRVISLFAGAGGMDLGFVRAGHEIVWANDNDQDSVETYRRNLGAHVVLGDITEISSSHIPDADVVIGGFPCQGFSRANLKRSPDDERNSLYLEFVRVIRDKQPRYFAAENVRGILSLDGGQVMEMIVEDFADAGYEVRYELFNMADFGVPQTRQRVVILGRRNDIQPSLEWEFPRPTHTKDPGLFDLKPWVSVGETLGGLAEPDEKHGLKNHIYSRYKVTNRDFTGHRRTDPSKPSPTILARGNGGGGVCALQHPRNHRRMSVRESAIVQTFPMDFEFVGSMGSTYRQVGNAVPPLFAERLAANLKDVEVDRGIEERGAA